MRNLFYILCFLVTNIVLAQTPQAINYQAVATNNSGTPISNTNIGVRISILAGSSTGTNVYTETHNTTTSAGGIFNVEIGRGSVQSGSFPNILWYAQPHFAKIDIAVNGGTNYQHIGTTQFLSVPYALFAENVAMIFRLNNVFPLSEFQTNRYVFRNDTLYLNFGRGLSNGFNIDVCGFVEYLGGEPENITISTTGFNNNISLQGVTFPLTINAQNFINQNVDCDDVAFTVNNNTPVGIYPLSITATNPRGRSKIQTIILNVQPCNTNTENDFVGNYYGTQGFTITNPVSINIPIVDTIVISNPINNDGLININSKLFGNIVCNRSGNSFSGTFNNITKTIEVSNTIFGNITITNASGNISGILCNGTIFLTNTFTSGIANSNSNLLSNINLSGYIGEGTYQK